MVPLRPASKRSRSPALSSAAAHENKRARAEEGCHLQPLPPPPNWQSQNKSRGRRNRPKNKQKQRNGVQNQNPNKQILGLKDLPPISNATRPIVTRLGRELDTTSKKPQSPGYVFVRSGNVYITRNCKRLTLESGRDLWRVDHPKEKGIQVPMNVYQTVLSNERATREMRKAAVDKVDKKEKDEARECLLKLFPNLPLGEDDAILGRAWERSSGRVGRTSKLSLEQKVRKAVVAHVRHAHSSYDQRLREEFTKNGRQRVAENIVQKARDESWKEVNAVVNSWKQRGAAQIVKPEINSAISNVKKNSKKEKTEEQRQAKRERKAQRRMNETEEQKKARQEKQKIKRKKREERRLSRLSKRASEQPEQELEGKDVKGEGGSKAIEFIIIDSDSEDDTVGNENSVDNDNRSKGIRSIDPWESDSEEVDDAKNWDIGEDENDDDDFFYAEDTEDEDYMDVESIDDVYSRETRRTRFGATTEKGENQAEDEGGGLKNEVGNIEDAFIEKEQIRRQEKAGPARFLVKNEGEIELDFDSIESAYQDLRLFNSISNTQTATAGMVTQKQAEVGKQGYQKSGTELNVLSTNTSNKGTTETPHERPHPQLENPMLKHRTGTQAEKETDQKKEKKPKTEVEEAEEELYRDFGFDEEESPSSDGFENMGAEVENQPVEVIKEVEMVEVKPEDKVEEKQENPETKPEDEPEDEPEGRPEDNQEIRPEVESEETASKVKPEDESDEEFVKKEYHVGGYIVEEFVRVKRVKTEVKKELVKRMRLGQASGSEQESKFNPGTSNEAYGDE